MKTQNFKSVIIGLTATAMLACFTISVQAETITAAKADTGKMSKMDKMSKGKMSKGKMSKGKMSKDKMSKDKMGMDKMSKDKMGKDKMAKKDTAGKM